MIVVNGNEFKTLADPIYVNGQRVSRVLVNGEQVYPSVAGTIIIKRPPDKLDYMPGDKLDYSGIEVSLVYQGGGEEVSIPFEELIFPVDFIPFSINTYYGMVHCQHEVGIRGTWTVEKDTQSTLKTFDYVLHSNSKYPMIFVYFLGEESPFDGRGSLAVMYIRISADKKWDVPWGTLGAQYNIQITEIVGEPSTELDPWIQTSGDLKWIGGPIVRAIIDAYDSAEYYTMDIPVQWERPEDGKILEAYFQIGVGNKGSEG